MRNTLFVFLIALGFVPIGPTQSARNKSQKELEIQGEVIRVDKDWGEAVAKSDKSALGSILADDFIAIGTRGELSGKMQNMDLTPPFSNSSYNADEYLVRVLSKDAVMLIHRGTYKGQQDGIAVSESHRSLHVLVRRQGRWQVVATGQTPIT